MSISGTQQAITVGLNENHFDWQVNADGILSASLKKSAIDDYSACLSLDAGGTWSPVLNEDFSIMLQNDIQKKKAVENFLQERQRTTYKRIVEEALANALYDNIKELLSAMEGECLNEFRKDDAFRAAHDEYIVQVNMAESQNKILDYNDIRQFCVVMSNTANKKKQEFEQAKHTNAKSYNSIKRAMDQVGLLYSYDVPTLVGGCRSILTLNESKHIKKPIKKSWFRRLIDKVKVFFGAEIKEEIDTQLYQTGSMEKAAVKIVTDQASGMYTNNAKEYIKYLKANKAARQKREKGQRVDFQLPKTELDAKASSTPAISKKGVVMGAAKAVATGVAGIAVANDPTGFLAGKDYDEGKKVATTSLATHIDDAFTLEAKKQAFETMMQFVRDMYFISDQVYANGEDKTVAGSMSLQALGFGRLEDEKFANFITRLSISLGFDLVAYKRSHPELKDIDELGIAVHLLFNADEKMREQAFAQFVEGDAEKGIGLQFASDAFNKEFNKMKARSESKIADSDNYFYILDLNKQVIEDLWMKTLNKNALHAALEYGGIEEHYYNPEASGAATTMTKALREQLVSALPSCMEQYVSSAVSKRELAQQVSASHCQGIKDEYDRRYEEKHPKPPVEEVVVREKSYLEAANENFWWLLGYTDQQTAESGKPESESRGVTTPLFAATKKNQKKWEAAESRVKEAGVPKAVRNELADIVREKTNKVWQKQAKHTTKTILDWGGLELLRDLNEALTLEYASMVEQEAHPQLLAEVQLQHQLLADVFMSYSDEPEKFMKMPVKDFKVLSDAIRTAITLKYTQGKFKNVDEQADLYMAMMALNQLNSIYLTSDIALKLYEDVLPTEFDEIQTQDMDALQKFAIDMVVQKSDEMYREAMSGPIKQFEYFVEQRKSEGYRLASGESTKGLASIPDKSAASQQSWLAWGASSAWSMFSGVTSLTADVISRHTGYNLSSVEVKTADELNQLIVDSTKEYIRGEFFDSTTHVIMELYDLVRVEENFEYLQALIGDDEKLNTFAKYGFGNKQEVLQFIDELSKELGFEDAKELYHLKTAEDDIISKRSIEEKKGEFSRVRKLQSEKIQDPFVSAKLVIRKENERLLARAKKGKLEDAPNYMVVMSSLEAMTGAVEMAQRETLAVEMLLPEADKMLGLSTEQKGLWDALVAAGEQRAKEYGQDALRRGIAGQLSDSITRAQHFPTAMIDEVANNLNNTLETTYSKVVVEEEVIDGFIARVGSADKAIAFFQGQQKENIKPYVLNALSLHLVKMNQPECCAALMALEKSKLDEFDEVYFWEDLISNAFAEQNFNFAAILLKDHIPQSLQAQVMDNLISHSIKNDTKSSIDFMLMLSLSESHELVAENLDMIKEINNNAYYDYNVTLSKVESTSYFGFGVGDNDLSRLSEKREIYVFMENVSQQLENEMIERSEHLSLLSENLVNHQRLKENEVLSEDELDLDEQLGHAVLDHATLIAYENQLESYKRVLENLNGLKKQWLQQEDILDYSFDNATRLQDYTKAWESEIQGIISHTEKEILKAEKVVAKYKKVLGPMPSAIPEPEPTPEREQSASKASRRKMH